MKFILPKSRSGFTLIELLIVIALLGALAVGLIGAIDPFEQLKKGADTGTRDLVNQVQTAIIRYYSVKNTMPWPDGSDPDKADLKTDPMPTAITAMINAGELKSNFAEIQASNLEKVFVTGSTDDGTAIVCYLPTAKSFKADPNAKYTQDGQLAAENGLDCPSADTPGTDKCYWCIQ